MVLSSGMDIDDTGELWRRTAGYPAEDAVIEALRLLEPALDRIHFVGGHDDVGGGYFRVRMSGEEAPVPLRSLGEGMHRMLEMALAIVNARDGMLLVDEFENGLHYSVLEGVWAYLFRLALSLNVQVFATTHSWDAVMAFQAAASTSAAEGCLVRLHRDQRGAVRAATFTEAELERVARVHIEVR